jgi:hypothetical protein
VWWVVYSFAVWCNRVCSQWVGGMEPYGLMQGRESECRDWMRTMVRQVSAQEVPRTWPVTGGV